MDFGRVPQELLNNINFKLMPDSPISKQLLSGKKNPKAKVYFGGPLWGEKAWLGKIYPKSCSSAEMLRFYAKNFGCIELNATHYKLYGEDQLRKWAEQTRQPDFKFCPKLTSSISHYSDLSSEKARELTNQFLMAIQGFGNQLGPCFLQLSEKFAWNRKDQLLKYLEQLPRDFKICLELRHEQWFEPNDAQLHFFEQLIQLNVGTVITDVAGRRDCAHMHITAPFQQVRFVANGLHHTDYYRAEQWIDRIIHWLENGLEELYFFIHQPDDILVPELTDYFIEQLNKRWSSDYPRIQFLNQQTSLF